MSDRHKGLASLMDMSTMPNVHFFCPYERAADALVAQLHEIPVNVWADEVGARREEQ
jgi:hypothetical protein